MCQAFHDMNFENLSGFFSFLTTVILNYLLLFTYILSCFVSLWLYSLEHAYSIAWLTPIHPSVSSPGTLSFRKPLCALISLPRLGEDYLHWALTAPVSASFMTLTVSC